MELAVAIPPLEQQTPVVDRIGCDVSTIDSLVVEAARAIALLRERRSALISAAVTGKIDVRGLAASRLQ